MADHRAQWNDAQWFEYGDGDGAATVSYVAATQFKVEGVDVTAVYHVGRRVKIVASTPGTIYGTINTVSFSTDTTVTVSFDSGSLSNEALTVSLGIMSQDNHAVPAHVWPATSPRNIIINGDMRIAQRGTSTAGIGASSGYFSTDRWNTYVMNAPQGRYTQTQESSGGPSNEFPNWLKMDVTTAESAVAATEAVVLEHRIEAQNLQHLFWGDATAKTLALTFWFRSPKTGTHCVGLHQVDTTRAYIREFTIASADTWERFTVTFPGDSSGVINNDNGNGLRMFWTIIAGTTQHISADTWSAVSDGLGTSNQQNLADNTANNIGLTGVQLEVGSAPTPFEHRNYGEELKNSLRYYNKRTATSAGDVFGNGANITTTQNQFFYPFPVPMRAASTLGTTGTAADYRLRHNTTAVCSVVPALGATATIFGAYMLSTVSSGLTTGEAGTLDGVNTNAYISFDAEL